MKPRPRHSSEYIRTMNVTAQAPNRVSTFRSVPAWRVDPFVLPSDNRGGGAGYLTAPPEALSAYQVPPNCLTPT